VYSERRRQNALAHSFRRSLCILGRSIGRELLGEWKTWMIERWRREREEGREGASERRSEGKRERG
jgi:hypothetical protein